MLEVLVALALIGLLFVSVGAVLQRQVETQRLLEENLAAAQLGWNLMENFHLQGRPLIPDLLEGEDEMAGWSFPWSRQIRAMEQGGWYQVHIQVGNKDNPLYLERWYWLAP